MTQLSPHFELSEFLVSETASRRGIDNTPGDQEIANLRLLCINVLEKVREHYGRPVIVTSGYRSPALNKAIGGASSSQHCLGEAADIHVPGVSNVDLARWMQANLAYDQLILEFHVPGRPDSGWVHVSWRMPCRNQELTAQLVGGKTRYLTGLIA